VSGVKTRTEVASERMAFALKVAWSREVGNASEVIARLPPAIDVAARDSAFRWRLDFWRCLHVLFRRTILRAAGQFLHPFADRARDRDAVRVQGRERVHQQGPGSTFQQRWRARYFHASRSGRNM
jgi:hypothetical protein